MGKNEVKRWDVMYKGAYPQITVELEEDIRMITPNMDRSVAYSDVKKVLESKNLLVIVLKGEITIALSKDGFQDVTAEECMDFLKEKIKQSKL